MLDPSTTIRWRKGFGTASDAAVAVDAQFQRKHLSHWGRSQTGLFRPSSIYSTSAVVGCRLGPAETGVDLPVPSVALDEIETLRAMAVMFGPIRIRRFSTGADRPAVGGKRRPVHKGEGRVVLHGLPEFVTGGVDPLEQLCVGMLFADDGQRRGIDVTERLKLSPSTGGVQRQQQHGQREAAGKTRERFFMVSGIWLYPFARRPADS